MLSFRQDYMSVYIHGTSDLQQMSTLNWKYTVNQIKLNITYGKSYFKLIRLYAGTYQLYKIKNLIKQNYLMPPLSNIKSVKLTLVFKLKLPSIYQDGKWLSSFRDWTTTAWVVSKLRFLSLRGCWCANTGFWNSFHLKNWLHF